MEAVIVSFLTKDQFVNSNDDLSLRKYNITFISLRMGALFNLKTFRSL